MCLRVILNKKRTVIAVVGLWYSCLLSAVVVCRGGGVLFLSHGGEGAGIPDPGHHVTPSMRIYSFR